MKTKLKTLNIILKADMQGSAEALQEALNKLSTSEVKIKLVLCGRRCALPNPMLILL